MTDLASSTEPTIDYSQLQEKLDKATTKLRLFQAIVDSPFVFKVETARMLLGAMVLLLVDNKTGMVNRVALSNTYLAKETLKVTYKRFEDIKFPLDQQENAIAKAIRTGKPQDVTDWKYLFVPALTAEHARLNQAAGGFAYSCVYPIPELKDGGALIFSYYLFSGKIRSSHRKFMRTYAKMVSKSLKAKGL